MEPMGRAEVLGSLNFGIQALESGIYGLGFCCFKVIRVMRVIKVIRVIRV